MVVELTDANFEDEVKKAEMPVLVDFYAPWCGPCRIVAPVMEKLATEYDGKFKFCKINVDDNPKTTRDYGVMSIPYLVFFKGGEKVEEIVGAVGDGVLKPKVDALLGS